MGDYIRNLRDSAGPVKGERAENSGGGQTGGGKNTWHDQYPTDEDSDESDSSSAFGDGHYRCLFLALFLVTSTSHSDAAA
jgi:hypothetical protein